MRSLALFMLVIAMLPFIFKAPHSGVLLWEWFTLMAPHKEVFGFVTTFKFNLIIALLTLMMWLVGKDRKFPPMTGTVLLFYIFFFWMFLVQLFSLKPDYSWTYFDRFVRSMILIFLVFALSYTKVRIHAVIWVLVLSVGYYGVIGGAFTIVTGGGYHVWGPVDTPIYDNNHLGLALVMMIPLMNYLRMHSAQKLVRFGLACAMCLCVFGVLGTQSRGGLISMSVMALFFWWYSPARTRLMFMALLVVIPAIYFMPESWYERMGTLSEGSAVEGGSFQGRVDAWIIAYDIALSNPLTGAGFRVPYLQDIADRFSTEYRQARAAHSIYFEILGSMGFTGLILYLSMGVATLLSTLRIAAIARKLPGMQWAHDLAKMSRASLLAYAVGGAAVSLEFWEGYWIQVAIMSNLLLLVTAERKRIQKLTFEDSEGEAQTHRSEAGMQSISSGRV